MWFMYGMCAISQYVVVAAVSIKGKRKNSKLKIIENEKTLLVVRCYLLTKNRYVLFIFIMEAWNVLLND